MGVFAFQGASWSLALALPRFAAAQVPRQRFRRAGLFAFSSGCYLRFALKLLYKTIGIEVKCGSSVGIGDFKNMKWFKSKFKIERFIGIVLYTGSDVLGFGNHMYAVPFANIVF